MSGEDFSPDYFALKIQPYRFEASAVSMFTGMIVAFATTLL